MKRWLALLLTALLTLSAISCAAQAEEAPLAFTMNIPFVPAYTEPEMMNYVNETYNVDINWLSLPGQPWDEDYGNKLKLLMSDYNTMPDVVYFTTDYCANDFQEWIDAGLLVDLAPYIKDMPNLVRYYEKEYQLDPFMSFFNSEDKTMYAIPADVGEKGERFLTARTDLMDKYNYHGGGTMEQFIQFLRDCVKGEEGVYGISGNRNDLSRFYQFFAAFGASPVFDEWIRQADGTIDWSCIQPGCKKALEVIAGMYAEGLIDPNLVTGGKDEWNDLLPNGVAATINQTIWAQAASCSSKYMFYEKFPGVRYDKIDPFTGPDGLGSDSFRSPYATIGIAITSKCADPARVIKFLDSIVAPEDFMRMMYGERDVDYKLDEQGEFVWLTDEDTRNKKGISMLMQLLQRKDKYNLENGARGGEYLADNANRTSLQAQGYTVFLRTTQRPMKLKYGSEIQTLRDTYYWSIITGEKPIDAFDEFVEKFYAIGGKEFVAEANEYYQKEKDERAVFTQWFDSEVQPNLGQYAAEPEI